MTSQQFQRKLADAINIIERCEQVFEDPDGAQSAGGDRDAIRQVRHFMDSHRQELREGGRP